MGKESIRRASSDDYCCGNCQYMENEDAYGWGWCAVHQAETYCGLECPNHITEKDFDDMEIRPIYDDKILAHDIAIAFQGYANRNLTQKVDRISRKEHDKSN